MNQLSEVTKSADNEKANKNNGNSLCDRIFQEIGGFGFYQILVGLSTGLALILGSFTTYNFIFASMIPKHRCWIPECESADTFNFNPEWLQYAIPHSKGVPDKCSRYQHIVGSSIDGICGKSNFNRSQIIPCDGYISENREQRLAAVVNLYCSDQDDKLPLIGTAATVGRFVGILFVGVMSDKFGRLNTMIGTKVVGAILSSLQALPGPFMTLEVYLTLQFFLAMVTSGTAGIVYTYNMEWVTAQYRIYLNCMAAFTSAFHPIIIGLTAWYFEDDFVSFKLAMGLPGLFMILFFLVLREPPQWLFARRKYSRAIKAVKQAGKINRRKPSAKLIERIESESIHIMEKTVPGENRAELTLLSLFKVKVLFFRMIVLGIIWLCTIFAYYGLMILSATAHENKYLSYVIIGLAEIPGAIFAFLTLDRFGRRKTLVFTLLTYGLMLVMSTQMGPEQKTVKLMMLFIARAAIKTTLIGLTTYTTELWPTSIRNSAINFFSFFGRVGSILATLSVILVKYYAQLPFILYGSGTLLASVLLFAFMPETAKMKKMPDTIEESLAIGKSAKSHQNKC